MPRRERARSTSTPIGISTGAWIEPDPDRRLGLIRRWHALPDFASVNFHEPGAAEIAEELLELGVGVEAGLSGPVAAEILARSGLEDRCLRVLLEPEEQDRSAALETVAAIERLLEQAVRRGVDARIGLEDTLRLPDGTAARDNPELIRAARTWISV